jgi:predicted adenylyl cyclase CyaB
VWNFRVCDVKSTEVVTQETEIKLRVESLEKAQALLLQHGFEILHPRIFERNLIFDTPDSTLRDSRRLLRLREAGGVVTLTFKGPAESGRHKTREEREVHPDNFDEMRIILERIGYSVRITYDKHRTEYQRMKTNGIATIDETPAGTFMELEGDAAWIDSTAAELGFAESDYVLASYAKIYEEAASGGKSEPVATALE